MIEEVYRNIYRIHVPLTGNPLKELNSYFIKSEDKQIVIDTGFRRDDCWEALKSALDELGADFDRLELVLTHFHSDHSGNANRVAVSGNKVYMGCTDVEYSLNRSDNADEFGRFLLKEGFLPEWREAQVRDNSAYKEWMENPFILNFVPMKTGDIISCGEYEFSWVLTPGHTPGNSMLYEAKHKIMFTGDNILFDITPNITHWEGFRDSLGAYLDSLRLSKEYDVEIAFPGHREFTGRDYYDRIDHLLEHHERRLAQALQIVRENPGFNATQICSQMTWKIRCRNWDDFPVVQRYFAVGETLSHLDYLKERGLVKKEEGSDGIYIYTALQ